MDRIMKIGFLSQP